MSFEEKRLIYQKPGETDQTILTRTPYRSCKSPFWPRNLSFIYLSGYLMHILGSLRYSMEFMRSYVKSLRLLISYKVYKFIEYLDSKMRRASRNNLSKRLGHRKNKNIKGRWFFYYKKKPKIKHFALLRFYMPILVFIFQHRMLLMFKHLQIAYI